MSRHNFHIVLLLGSLLLAGCATPTKMAFGDDAEKLTTASPPIYLMSVTLKNSYHTSYQPKLQIVHLERPNAKSAGDRLNFKVDDRARNEIDTADAGNRYLVRMPLTAGLYEVEGMTSMSGSFPIRGFFITPLLLPMEAGPPGVYYLGHIKATVRERDGKEFMAGPPIPLIDQAVVGASGGTFDVEVADDWPSDESMFRSRFSALKGVEVKKAILPAFDRDKAQKWWEEN